MDEFKNAHPIPATILTVAAFIIVAMLIVTLMAAVGMACAAFLARMADAL